MGRSSGSSTGPRGSLGRKGSGTGEHKDAMRRGNSTASHKGSVGNEIPARNPSEAQESSSVGPGRNGSLKKKGDRTKTIDQDTSDQLWPRASGGFQLHS